MRKKINVLLLMLIAYAELSSCKQNKTKNIKTNQKSVQNDSEAERAKRSIDDEEDKPFWANRGKKQSEEDDFSPNSIDFPQKNNQFRSDKIDKEPPFWGNRGRRDSSEEIESYEDSKSYDRPNFCAHCKGALKFRQYSDYSQQRRDEMDPFWGNRGRRDEEISDSSPFWGNRGRRQDEEPFWGTRGRREELPFWGNRGRRENFFRESWERRRMEDENPFWGNRGRRDEVEPFWGNRGRRNLKESILEAINNAEDNQYNIYNTKHSYWNNNGRDSTLKHLFNGGPRVRKDKIKKNPVILSGAGTVLDDRIYAEQPHYILIERSSRSSSEDDPYFISRGKKLSQDWAKVARYRRTTIKDLFNSVKSDPYFIARGKKDSVRFKNSTIPSAAFTKTKELICATIDLMLGRNKDGKRSIDDSDRGRRAVLQKLAAQLQSDPYFVSRGKKEYSEESVAEFVSELKAMCY